MYSIIKSYRLAVQNEIKYFVVGSYQRLTVPLKVNKDKYHMLSIMIKKKFAQSD